MNKWQPIETAPKNKKVLVGYRNTHGQWRNVTAIYYKAETLPTGQITDEGEDEFSPEDWYETSEGHDCILQTDYPPTHWMPLPMPPNNQGNAPHGDV